MGCSTNAARQWGLASSASGSASHSPNPVLLVGFSACPACFPPLLLRRHRDIPETGARVRDACLALVHLLRWFGPTKGDIEPSLLLLVVGVAVVARSQTSGWTLSKSSSVALPYARPSRSQCRHFACDWVALGTVSISMSQIDDSHRVAWRIALMCADGSSKSFRPSRSNTCAILPTWTSSPRSSRAERAPFRSVSHVSRARLLPFTFAASSDNFSGSAAYSLRSLRQCPTSPLTGPLLPAPCAGQDYPR